LKEEIIFKSSDYEQTEICCHYCGSHRLFSYFFFFLLQIHKCDDNTVALIGLIATFLPWYKIVQLGTISGMSSSGWFTFIMFIIVIILALRKDLHEDLSMGISWSITICSLLASFVVLWKIIDVWFAQEGMFSLGGGMEGILGSQVSIAYGAWIVTIAGICVPFAGYLFRNKSFRRV